MSHEEQLPNQHQPLFPQLKIIQKNHLKEPVYTREPRDPRYQYIAHWDQFKTLSPDQAVQAVYNRALKYYWNSGTKEVIMALKVPDIKAYLSTLHPTQAQKIKLNHTALFKLFFSLISNRIFTSQGIPALDIWTLRS